MTSPTIQEIMSDPRYGEFAADVTARGRQVVPDGFPWNCMGHTDDEILAMMLRFSDGRPMPRTQVESLLPVVRTQERLVREWWAWWGSWEWIEKGRARARAETKLVPVAGKPKAGMLF